MAMRALSVVAPNQVELVERALPEIGDGDALVRVAAATICHTDHYILAGGIPGLSYPVTPGHEFSGVVEAVGAGVTRVEPGARVAVETYLSCGDCRHCRRGRINLCADLREMGFQLPGGFGQYIVAPAAKLHPIDDSFSLEEAAMTEPSANAHAVVRRAGIEAGQSVAVIGPGPIGLLVMQYARLRDPGQLILVGLPRDKDRLAMGKRLGATDTVALPAEAAKEKILELTGGLGADRVLQCAGSTRAAELALDVAGVNATVVIEGGGETIPLALNGLIQRQLTIRGMCGWSSSDFAATLRINQSGRIELRALLTHRFALQEHAAAFEMTRQYSDGVIKAAFVPQES